MSYITNYTFNNSGTTVDIGTIFCDLTNNQTVSGKKQFSKDISLNGNVTINTVGASFTVSGNLTVGNLNAINNLYINGSVVATQSYISGLNYLTTSAANSTYAIVGSNNTFTGRQKFNIVACSNLITSGKGLRMTSGGPGTFDGGLTITSGSITLCSSPSLTYTTQPTIDLTFMGGTATGKTGYTFGTSFTFMNFTVVNNTTVNIASVVVPSPGTYLFVAYVGLTMGGGGGGTFWYNFGIGSGTTDATMYFWLSYFEYISFGNVQTYPVHTAPFIYTISTANTTIYLNAKAYGIDSLSLPAGNISTYGSLTAVRLS
jgi:hypothetical protein